MKIDGNQYTLVFDHKTNDNTRNSFNELARQVYGFDFETWYQDGYWGEQYIPYSLLDGETVVANASVNIMDFLVLGEKKRYIQIGTVMTDENYRGKGLIRALIEKIMNDFENKCSLIYLFANDSVLDFYPKFGFEKAKEFQYSKSVIKKQDSIVASKLDMSSEANRTLLFETANSRMSFSKLTMLNNPSLVMFYCTSSMSDDVYYIEEYNAIAIATFDESILYLHDIFSINSVSTNKIINSLIDDNTRKIILGFVPEDISSYEMNLLQKEDTTLFLKKSNEDFPENLIFPILSHA